MSQRIECQEAVAPEVAPLEQEETRMFDVARGALREELRAGGRVVGGRGGGREAREVVAEQLVEPLRPVLERALGLQRVPERLRHLTHVLVGALAHPVGLLLHTHTQTHVAPLACPLSVVHCPLSMAIFLRIVDYSNSPTLLAGPFTWEMERAVRVHVGALKWSPLTWMWWKSMRVRSASICEHGERTPWTRR